MKFIYTGFTHETTGVRQYDFEGVVSPGIRKGFLVTADVALLTKHHIQIQDAPMMCMRLLEGSAEAEPQLDLLVLTEADMVTHALARAAEKEAAGTRRTRRTFRPANAATSAMAWKSQPPALTKSEDAQQGPDAAP